MAFWIYVLNKEITITFILMFENARKQKSV